ncbi:RNA-binding domain-containing protein [Actinomycetaceae bacterium L2_0104]
MTQEELRTLLDRLLSGWENEVVEFKEGGAGYSTSDIGKYFSALANEANLHGVTAGWLVFGVRNRDRLIVGTGFRQTAEELQMLKNQIANGTETHASFREIHELNTEYGRVLLFEIPPAPRGIPVAWNGHYFARNGESLGSLSLGKSDEIRSQDVGNDWSAGVVLNATVDDLDPEALEAAREAFHTRRRSRISREEIASWSTEDFLEKARLTTWGGITRATLLLLGRPESTHLLSPLLAEITWRLVGEERVYEHFSPPFVLATSKVYERIRNYNIRMMQPGTLIQTEVQKYEKASVMEAIHNCVAHADYGTGARIVVQEYPDRIVLQNSGPFIEGVPEDYVLRNRVPRTYRNPFLVKAMVELNMIDQLGSGISSMTRSQAHRFLPLPDYDFDEPGAVSLTIHGAVIDQNFSQMLMTHTDLPMSDVLALDRIQKNQEIPSDAQRRLKRLGLIEGRRPHLRVSAQVAAMTGKRADYIRTRALDDKHYEKLIIEYIEQFESATRADLDEFLTDKFSDVLGPEEKYRKLSSLLTRLRKAGEIENVGGRKHSVWETVKKNK